MTLVQKEPKKIYIWKEYQERTPSSGDVYFPLDSTYQLNSYDSSKTLTVVSGSYTFTDNSVTASSSAVLRIELSNLQNYTLFGWINEYGYIAFSSKNTATSPWYGREVFRTTDTNVNFLSVRGNTTNVNQNITVTSGWHSFVVVCSSSTGGQLYIDKQLAVNGSGYVDTNQNYLIIYTGNGGAIGKVGISNTQRNATKIFNYHNGTYRHYE